jgi:hypothetical protein
LFHLLIVFPLHFSHIVDEFISKLIPQYLLSLFLLLLEHDSF